MSRFTETILVPWRTRVANVHSASRAWGRSVWRALGTVYEQVTATAADAPKSRRHAAIIMMSRLGMAGVTIIATLLCTLLSVLVAWMASFAVEVPNYQVHIILAAIIPLFVTPLFSYLTGLSMRDMRRARAQSHMLAAQTERERMYLDLAVNNMPIGLVMFDDDKKLIVCNDAYRAIYDLPASVTERGVHLRDMLLQRLDAGNFEGTDRDAYIDRIMQMVDRKEHSVRLAELGDGRMVQIVHQPIAVGGWVGVHEDITERQKLTAMLERQNALLRAKEGQLETRNVQLDAALNNMVQGLAMFDDGYRLVVCNQRYREIYGLTEAEGRPGALLRDIIATRERKGLYANRSARNIVDLMLSHRDDEPMKQFQSELSDGRCIAITVQPMADGGTVTTHQDVTEQQRSKAKIAHMALHDALTGLPNRVLLNEQLGASLAHTETEEVVAVHLLDLDRFKHVNDTLGHPVGDKLLQLVTERLRAAVRDTDTIARMGGDEFAIVQVGISQPADAAALAVRVIEDLSRPYVIDEQNVLIGTSVGIAIGPLNGREPEQLLRHADMALYRAKDDGRGTFRFFEPEMGARMRDRRAMENDLRSALVRGEFELHYQPIIALAKDKLCGFEALIRWRHPERGLLPPSAFLPLAEEIGLIVPIGEWAIRHACAVAARWPEELRVAVNLSPLQFGTPGLAEVVVGALSAARLDPARLELEITETSLLNDSERTLNTLFALRRIGVSISMDDFGTGYSSLSYLQSFPFDKIKIDRSFIADIAAGTGSLDIVRAVAALAKGLGMTTTAEGVETEEQLAAIRSEGCGEAQGFLFSRPLPEAEIERLYLAARRVGMHRASDAA